MSLLLRGDRAISQAAHAARSFGNALGLASDDLARLCIVVEELVANLYDHGGVTQQDEVQLLLAADSQGIRVTIVDPGAPFDPWSALKTAISTEGGGGAGLRLIRAWAEVIDYRSSSDGNRLELLLPLGRES